MNRLVSSVFSRNVLTLLFSVAFVLFLADKGQAQCFGSERVVGTGKQGYNGDNVLAKLAQLNAVVSIAFDKAGNLYIPDVNNYRIRKVNAADGKISTIAGTGVSGYSGDGGPATAAQIGFCKVIALDAADNIYFYESTRVRKINASDGTISTIMGAASPYSDSEGTPASNFFTNINGMAFDANGNLLFTDPSKVRMLKKSDNKVYTIAGASYTGFAGDGGPAINAQLNQPQGICVDAAGNIYVADANNFKVRKIGVNGTISTIAGTSQGIAGDGGPAVNAQMNQPWGLAMDASGKNLSVAEVLAARIRKIDLTSGTISTYGGSTAWGDHYRGLTLHTPIAVAFNPAGNLFVALRDSFCVYKLPAVACDNPPTDITAGLSRLDENASGVNLGYFYTTDPDPNNTFTYELVSGFGDTDNGSFAFNGSMLRITAAVNYEKSTTCSIRVRSKDQAGLSFEKVFVIPVFDKDEPPTDINISSSSIDENKVSGSTVGILSAVDDDANSSFTYSLVSGAVDNASFALSGAGNGTLNTKFNTNYEAKSSYSIRILATDNKSLSVEKLMTITINDLNEAPTDVALAPSSINENVADGSTIGIFSSIDPDGNTVGNFTYSLVSGTGDTDNGLFSLSGSGNSILNIVSSPDYETKNTYSIRIRTTDKGGLSFDRVLTVQITDVVENRAPVLSGLNLQAICAGRTSAAIGFSVSDPDGGNLTLSATSSNTTLLPVSGIVFNTNVGVSGSRTVTFTPSGNQTGKSIVTIMVSDGSLSKAVSFELNVAIQSTASLISTYAGNGTSGHSGDGGSMTLAQIAANQISIDGFGNMYIAEAGVGYVRKINMASGVITTIAGNGTNGFSGDGGAATAASLFSPRDAKADANGNVYIVDQANNRLRKVSASTGIISTVAGGGVTTGGIGDDGPATGAILDNPCSIAIDANGNIYLGDFGTSTVRRIDAQTGIITRFAGVTYNSGKSGDGGPARNALLGQVHSLNVDKDGNLYIGDGGNHTIRKVNVSTGIISTIAGNGADGYSGDGGLAVNASLRTPMGIELDEFGNLYFGDYGTRVVRKINAADGKISTVAGTGLQGYSGDGGSPKDAQMSAIVGLEMDAANNLYISDGFNGRIRKVSFGYTLDCNRAPSDITLSASTIDENKPGNSAVGTFSTSDSDGNTASDFTYALVSGDGSTDNSSFTLSGDGSGALLIKSSPNYEAKSSYSIRVRTTDQGGLSVDKSFTIAINNIYESPTDISLSSSVVVEGASIGSSVGNLSSVDPDGNIASNFSYSLVSGAGSVDNEYFSLSGTNKSMLTIGVVADYEKKSSYSIRIRTTDKEGLSFEKVFTIAVQNQNETPTDLALSSSSINENVVAGSAVGTFSSVDPDGNTASNFTYSLVSGVGSTDNSSFSLTGARNATLTMVSSPDYEIKNSYSIRVRSTDNGGLYLEKVFLIAITDMSEDRAPMISSIGYQAICAGKTSKAFSFSASDPDGNPITISSSSTNSSLLPVSGIVVEGTGANRTVKFIPTGGQIGTSTVTLTASDGTKTSQVSFDITVATQSTPMTAVYVAGTGTAGYNGDNILGSQALVNKPQQMAADKFGNLYFCDSENHRIRKINTADGIISTVAGTGVKGFSGDGGLAINAQLNTPMAIAIDPSGNIYFSDLLNGRIRVINIGTGVITTFGGGNANTAADGALIMDAHCTNIQSMSFDASGNLYFCINTQFVRRVNASDSRVYTIAGQNGRTGYSPDGTPATQSYLSAPSGVCVDAAGNIYISDMNNNLVRVINKSNGLLGTYAGNGSGSASGNAGDGGAATSAMVYMPAQITFDVNGDLIIAEYFGSRIRRVNKSTGIISSVASMNGTWGCAVDPSNNVYGSSNNLQSIFRANPAVALNCNAAPTDIALSVSSIDENIPAGNILAAMSTTDEDNGSTFTYALVSGEGSTHNGVFGINGSNLYMHSAADYETLNQYSIRIRSTDQTGLFVEKAFTIKVNNLNEKPTDISLSANNFNENIAAGSTAVTLSSTDPEGGSVYTYALVTGSGSTNNAAFTIEGNNLNIANSPNYEIQNSYSVRIRTTDAAGLSFEKVFMLLVNNLNETPTDLLISASSCNENVATNTTIGNLSSTDPESGTFTYTLVAGTGDTHNESFNISGNALRITNSPNYEQQKQYSIRVRTTDQGGLSFEKVFNITIADLNESPTDITLSASSFDENTLASTSLVAINAVDPEGGVGYTYSLVSGTGDTHNTSFTISGNNLYLKISADYEKLNAYSIRLRTTDANGLYFEKVFALSVNDVNEKPSEVKLSNYSCNENIAAGSTVATLISVDPEGASDFIYSLLEGSNSEDNALFAIEGNKLKILVSPNFEAKSYYRVRVRSTDPGGLHSEYWLLSMNVSNLNEAPTELTVQSTSFNENISPNTFLTGFNGLDPESYTSNLTYSLVSGEGDTHNALFNFYVNGLRMNSTPNYEVQNQYSIRVRVSDKEGLGLEKMFSLNVLDVNENPTDIKVSAASFDEGIAAGSTVATLSTEDPEGGTNYTYSFIGGTGSTHNGSFTISGDALKIQAVPNYTVQNTYNVRIRTVDAAGLSLEKAFTFTVRNIDDAPTNMSLSASSINENVPANTVVGSLTAVDPDGGSGYTYSLVSGTGDTNNGDFAISGSSLSVKVSPNFEAQNSYSIRIRLTDANGSTIEKVFVISVINVQEPPNDITLSSSTVTENVVAGTTVGALGGTDPDGGNLSFVLVSGTGDTDNGLFNLFGTNNSMLRINVVPNYEAKKTYSIRMRVADQYALYYDEILAITVNDVNEAPTGFTLSASSINENVAANSEVGTLSASDVDADNTFMYSLVSGAGSTDNAFFTISNSSLLIVASPDYETRNSYAVRIRVTDQGGLSVEKALTISVNNLNEAPSNLLLSASAVNENLTPNSVVGTLSSTDPDLNSTAFTYSMVSGEGDADNALFMVNGDFLRITVSPDYESKSAYSVRVRTTDQGGLSFEKVMSITVNNLNEAPTDIQLSSSTINENMPASSVVGSLSTTDPDAGNSFTYSLATGPGSTHNTFFSITGNLLRINNGPNYEVQNSYSIRIRTTDQVGLSFEKVVSITVLDIKEAPYIVKLVDLSACEGSTIPQQALFLSDPEGGSLSLSASSSNAALLPVSGIVFNLATGTSTNRTVNFSTVAGQYGTSTVKIVVSDAEGLKDSTTFQVLVGQLPVLSGQPAAQSICQGSTATMTVLSSGGSVKSYQWQWRKAGLGSFVNLNDTLGKWVTTTQASMTIQNAATHLDGTEYRCIVSAECGTLLTSSAAALVVFAKPNILTEVSNASVCEGSDAVFSIAAPGKGLIYQWQKSSVGPATGFANINGATTMSIAVKATAELHNNYYRCIVSSNNCSPADTSVSGKLTVLKLPAVISATKDTVVIDQTNTGFQVKASGDGLSYQWQVNKGSSFENILSTDALYSGVNNAVLTFKASTSMNGYKYRCVLSGSCPPGVETAAATLTVRVKVKIIDQPVAQTICELQSAIFNVTAVGSGLTYQWQRSLDGLVFLPILGANSSSLSIPPAPLSLNQSLYRVVITDASNNTETSTVVPLTVNQQARITADPKPTAVCSGSSAGFRVKATGTSITYAWLESVDGGLNFHPVTGSNYQGATTDSLRIVDVTASYHNYRYRCKVSGCSGDTLSQPAVLTVLPMTVIVKQPEAPTSATTCEGVDVSLRITATGYNTLQWQENKGSGYVNMKNGTQVMGVTDSVLTLKNLTAAQSAYRYRCVVAGTCNTMHSNEIQVVVPQAFSLSANQVNEKCFGDTIGQAEAIPSIAGAYTYTWSNGKTTAKIVNLRAGTYTVEVKNAMGCKAGASVTITEPLPLAATVESPLNALGNQISAFGQDDGQVLSSVTGGTFPYSYLWSNGSTLPSLSQLGPGLYTLSVTDANGCKVSAQQVLSQPNPLKITGGFSPNGDGRNDALIIENIDNYSLNTVEILKNGIPVRTFLNYSNSNPWDGTLLGGGAIPDGSYLVRVITYVKGVRQVLNSYIELRR